MKIRTPLEFGLAIRDKRKNLGLTQNELAGKVGAGRQWVVSIEQGRPRAEIGLVLRALSVLGITLTIDTGDAVHSKSEKISPVDIDGIVNASKENRK